MPRPPAATSSEEQIKKEVAAVDVVVAAPDDDVAADREEEEEQKKRRRRKEKKKRRRRAPSEEEEAALRSVLRWARRGEAGDEEADGQRPAATGRRRPRVAVELHAHSTCSDGSLSPAALVQRAHRNGVSSKHSTEMPANTNDLGHACTRRHRKSSRFLTLMPL